MNPENMTLGTSNLYIFQNKFGIVKNQDNAI